MSASLSSGSRFRADKSSNPLAAIASSFSCWGRALWRGMTAVGTSRARLHLQTLAVQYEHSDPALARELRASVDGMRRG